MLSLRARALVGGILSALVAIVVGTYVLYTYIDGIVLERFDASLLERHTQLIVGLSNAADNPQLLDQLIFDPGYQTPYSGRYWQIMGPEGQVFASASMFDAALAEPTDRPNQIAIRNIPGPENEPVRSMYQRITLEDGSEWGVMVAETLTELTAEREQTRRSLLLAFALVGMIGLAGGILQTAAILRPLEKLRRDVSHRWKKDEDLNVADYPAEVAPLVGDINELLDRNREIVSRGRRQASDLAHALKTPSAILRNELTVLAEQNHNMGKSIDALDRVDAQLVRSLARIRAANSGASTNYRTDIDHSIDRFSRLFSSMAQREGKELRTQGKLSLTVRIDPQDFEEVLGNLLDNALKWCDHVVKLSMHHRPGGIELLIEDDGLGIPEKSLRKALRAGGRLDTSKPGTGLGLAIASDLLKAYGANLHLEKSNDLGGLAVRVLFPDELIGPV